jgi:protease I
MVEPRNALDQAGAETRIVSPRDKHVRGWSHTNWGDQFAVDVALNQARPQEFDALLLPGGVMNPDMLRMEPKAVAFAKAFFDAGKPVAAICHGPWTIIETGATRGRRIASWPSLKTDLRKPVRSGWTKRLSSMAIWCRAASPTTSLHSTGR